MEINKKINSIIDLLKNKDVRRVILFGSRARGENRKNSDIDLCVEFKNNLSFREKRKLKEELESLTGLYSLDLIFYDEIDEKFKAHILKQGRLLYEKDGSSIKD
jgi:predicted nucleotidyltransferase